MKEHGTEEMRIITISTRSYLDRVSVLADSLSRHHPDARLTCYLAESAADEADSRGGLFDVVTVENLDIPNRNHFFFQYTAFELCCALKPFCLLHELNAGHKMVLFLDADMFVTAPFLDIVESRSGDVILTPHVRRPDIPVDFHYFLKTGHFNAGFVGVRNTEGAREMLEWWRDRLRKDCYQDYMGGVLDDQGWLDMAAALFDAHSALRHPGINVAHWNLHECEFSKRGDALFAGDVPLCLFHFSTFLYPGLTKHQMVSNTVPDPVEELAARYDRLLKKVRTNSPAASPYSFATFTNGEEITPAMREAVRTGLIPDEINPFSSPDVVQNALPKGDPDSILKGRADYLFASRQLQQEEIERMKPRLWLAENQLARIKSHPVIGRLLRFWKRFINPGLGVE